MVIYRVNFNLKERGAYIRGVGVIIDSTILFTGKGAYSRTRDAYHRGRARKQFTVKVLFHTNYSNWKVSSPDANKVGNGLPAKIYVKEVIGPSLYFTKR